MVRSTLLLVFVVACGGAPSHEPTPSAPAHASARPAAPSIEDAIARCDALLAGTPSDDPARLDRHHHCVELRLERATTLAAHARSLSPGVTGDWPAPSERSEVEQAANAAWERAEVAAEDVIQQYQQLAVEDDGGRFEEEMLATVATLRAFQGDDAAALAAWGRLAERYRGSARSFASLDAAHAALQRHYAAGMSCEVLRSWIEGESFRAPLDDVPVPSPCVAQGHRDPNPTQPARPTVPRRAIIEAVEELLASVQPCPSDGSAAVTITFRADGAITAIRGDDEALLACVRERLSGRRLSIEPGAAVSFPYRPIVTP